MGRVDDTTTGRSAGTLDTDVQAWQSAGQADHKITLRLIDEPDANVDAIAESLVENKEYQYMPKESNSNTANSNSAAGAIASRADGGSASVKNSRLQPGHTSSQHVEFEEERR